MISYSIPKDNFKIFDIWFSVSWVLVAGSLKVRRTKLHVGEVQKKLHLFANKEKSGTFIRTNASY